MSATPERCADAPPPSGPVPHGGFEMGDGRITSWRDYFDLGTYFNAMA